MDAGDAAGPAAAPVQPPASEERGGPGQGPGEAPAGAGQGAQRPPRVLLAATGSVAAIKLGQLWELLRQFAEVKVMATKAALHFVPLEELPAVLDDDQEWRDWRAVGDPVQHIELRRWADALVVAPLSANTLAKVANGLCDNLVTCVVRAWDWSKPLLLAPAMNTCMWDSPITAQQLEACQRLGALVVPPVTKRLACGDVGGGAMAAPGDVAAACRRSLEARGWRCDVQGGARC